MRSGCRRCRGFSLLEALVALALAAGPLLVALNLIQSNVSAARYNVERATARLVLMDLTEMLLGETLEELRDTGNVQGKLAAVLSGRTVHLPEAARKQYRDQVAPIVPRLHCRLEENVSGVPGLARITLWVDLESGAQIRVCRLFRPDARTLPPRGRH